MKREGSMCVYVERWVEELVGMEREGSMWVYGERWVEAEVGNGW